jgi:protoheme IX farnesyltransferase
MTIAARGLRHRTVDLVALVKPRIMVMALLTCAGAMSLAPGELSPGRALWLIAGTALIVGSANTLNMWLERDIDCLMARTRNRPLPR